ncbi:hypothetical protein D1007_23520 [Hordeum vulgare]|nr:hypothetical protein D1007_23520 [Hordeum vulgare]
MNPDFLGSPLSKAVHAEQFLIGNAAAVVEPALRVIAVSHMPCSHCRQTSEPETVVDSDTSMNLTELEDI